MYRNISDVRLSKQFKREGLTNKQTNIHVYNISQDEQVTLNNNRCYPKPAFNKCRGSDGLVVKYLDYQLGNLNSVPDLHLSNQVQIKFNYYLLVYGRNNKAVILIIEIIT